MSRKGNTQTEERWRELMIAAQEGNAKAFNQLLSELAPVIQRFANKRVGRVCSIDDIVQDALISIHKARNSYLPDRPFTPWFFAIVRRRMVDHIRTSVRLNSREVYDESGVAEEVYQSETDYDDPRLDFMHQAIESLPPKYKEPVWLVKIEEKSVKEAAAALSISEAAVKTRLSRGYKMLKTKIEKLAYDV